MNLTKRLYLLASQAVNALVFAGDPDEPLSARAYRERYKNPETIRCLDEWLGEGHCQRVFEEQLGRTIKRNNSQG